MSALIGQNWPFILNAINGIIFINTLNDGYWGIYRDEMEVTGYGDNLDLVENE
jgi:hypothetical protein